MAPKFRQNPNVERAPLNPKQILGPELTQPMDQEGKAAWAVGGSLCLLPGQNPWQIPRWRGFVTCPTLVPHSASQSPGLSHLEFISKPCSSSTLPVQNSCFPSSCPKLTPAHVFLYLFCLPSCAPKPPVCHRPELLSASVPSLPSLPGSLLSGSAPTTMSFHPEWLHHVHSLPQATGPAGGPAVDYCYCGLCCPSPKL